MLLAVALRRSLVPTVFFYEYMSYSLNSFKGGYIGDSIGDYYRGY